MCPTCGHVADPGMPMWAILAFAAVGVVVALAYAWALQKAWYD